MIDRPNDPAFPFKGEYIDATGISTRCYIATAALKSMHVYHSDNPLYWASVARTCCMAADAILAELAKEAK